MWCESHIFWFVSYVSIAYLLYRIHKKMPLTKAGEKTKKAMVKEYGKKKGEQVFYAYENKHKGESGRKALTK